MLSLEGTSYVVPVLVFLLGGLARVVVPYLQSIVDNPEQPFDLRYLIGQLLGLFVGLVPAIFTDEFVSGLLSMSAIATFLLGWSMADVGRVVHKLSGILSPE